MASLSYTRKNGEVPKDDLGVTRSAHRALWSALCQFRFWENRVFLMMWMRFLLVDSANPFP